MGVANEREGRWGESDQADMRVFQPCCLTLARALLGVGASWKQLKRKGLCPSQCPSYRFPPSPGKEKMRGWEGLIPRESNPVVQ